MSDFDDDLPEEDVRAPRSGAERSSGSARQTRRPADEGRRPAPTDDVDEWDDDWDDDDDRAPGAGRRDLSIILAIVAAVAIIALVVVLSTKDDKNDNATPGNGQTPAGETTLPNKNWQGTVAEGVGEQAKDVKARVAKESGLYIWTDFNGWHLRNTTDNTLSVTIEAETVVATDNAGKPIGEPGTSVDVDVPKGDADTGIDLDLGGSTEATFIVKDGSSNLPASDIKLGGKSGEAEANPVKFTKA